MTKGQQDLLNNYFLMLSDEDKPIYQEILEGLLELGYSPRKEKSNISFKYTLHNKQIAKMGVKKSKNSLEIPFFALRFSACKGYSQRFSDIVSAAIIKYPSKTAGCMTGNCAFCAGLPHSHVYECTFQNGETKYHCGAYALEIPNIGAEDIPEIKRMLKEEHDYLMKNEVVRQ